MFGQVENPMHKRKPSAAYMESWKRAQEERKKRGWKEDTYEYKPGWRTVLFSILCFIAGSVLFIIGAEYRWTSNGTEKHNQGMDLLIIGGILLLPGSYACWVLLGAFLKWPGYHYAQVPDMDSIT